MSRTTRKIPWRGSTGGKGFTGFDHQYYRDYDHRVERILFRQGMVPWRFLPKEFRNGFIDEETNRKRAEIELAINMHRLIYRDGLSHRQRQHGIALTKKHIRRGERFKLKRELEKLLDEYYEEDDETGILAHEVSCF